MRLFFRYTLCVAAYASCAVASAGVVREASFDGCRFTMVDSYGGSLEVSEYFPPKLAFYSLPLVSGSNNKVETSITFSCKTAIGQKAFSDMGIAHEHGEWSLLPDKSDPDNLANQKIYRIQELGMEGAVLTYDQTTGEEERRTQGVGFCLTNQKQILCGTSESVGYVAYPKQSNFPKVIELLKTIRLLDPSSP